MSPTRTEQWARNSSVRGGPSFTDGGSLMISSVVLPLDPPMVMKYSQIRLNKEWYSFTI